MAKVMNLEVVTPERILFNLKIDSLVVPAGKGLLGILYNHAPLITGLQPGVLKYGQKGQEYFAAIGSGFMEVLANKITILVDSAEKPEEIDIERARAAKERAEKRLLSRDPGLDIQRAELALYRAIARLKVATET